MTCGPRWRPLRHNPGRAIPAQAKFRRRNKTLSRPARPLPKLARYQTALRPALSILRLLAPPRPWRNSAKREHKARFATNFGTIQSHDVRRRFPLTVAAPSLAGFEAAWASRPPAR